MGLSLTPTVAVDPEPEQAEPTRSAARPKLVSKRSRARLFVLPTRSE
jgi:hypothetical protein